MREKARQSFPFPWLTSRPSQTDGDLNNASMCRYAAVQFSSAAARKGGRVTPLGPFGNHKLQVEELFERSLGGKRKDLESLRCLI